MKEKFLILEYSTYLNLNLADSKRFILFSKFKK